MLNEQRQKLKKGFAILSIFLVLNQNAVQAYDNVSHPASPSGGASVDKLTNTPRTGSNNPLNKRHNNGNTPIENAAGNIRKATSSSSVTTVLGMLGYSAPSGSRDYMQGETDVTNNGSEFYDFVCNGNPKDERNKGAAKLGKGLKIDACTYTESSTGSVTVNRIDLSICSSYLLGVTCEKPEDWVKITNYTGGAKLVEPFFSAAQQTAGVNLTGVSCQMPNIGFKTVVEEGFKFDPTTGEQGSYTTKTTQTYEENLITQEYNEHIQNGGTLDSYKTLRKNQLIAEGKWFPTCRLTYDYGTVKKLDSGTNGRRGYELVNSGGRKTITGVGELAKSYDNDVVNLTKAQAAANKGAQCTIASLISGQENPFATGKVDKKFADNAACGDGKLKVTEPDGTIRYIDYNVEGSQYNTISDSVPNCNTTSTEGTCTSNIPISTFTKKHEIKECSMYRSNRINTCQETQNAQVQCNSAMPGTYVYANTLSSNLPGAPSINDVNDYCRAEVFYRNVLDASGTYEKSQQSYVSSLASACDSKENTTSDIKDDYYSRVSDIYSSNSWTTSTSCSSVNTSCNPGTPPACSYSGNAPDWINKTDYVSGSCSSNTYCIAYNTAQQPYSCPQQQCTTDPVTGVQSCTTVTGTCYQTVNTTCKTYQTDYYCSNTRYCGQTHNQLSYTCTKKEPYCVSPYVRRDATQDGICQTQSATVTFPWTQNCLPWRNLRLPASSPPSIGVTETAMAGEDAFCYEYNYECLRDQRDSSKTWKILGTAYASGGQTNVGPDMCSKMKLDFMCWSYDKSSNCSEDVLRDYVRKPNDYELTTANEIPVNTDYWNSATTWMPSDGTYSSYFGNTYSSYLNKSNWRSFYFKPVYKNWKSTFVSREALFNPPLLVPYDRCSAEYDLTQIDLVTPNPNITHQPRGLSSKVDCITDNTLGCAPDSCSVTNTTEEGYNAKGLPTLLKQTYICRSGSGGSICGQSAPEGDGSMSKVLSAAAILEAIQKDSKWDNGELRIFGGTPVMCKQVTDDFKASVESAAFQVTLLAIFFAGPVGAALAALAASAVKDAVFKMHCCKDHPSQVDVAGTFGYCTILDVQLAAAKLAKRTKFVYDWVDKNASYCTYMDDWSGTFLPNERGSAYEASGVCNELLANHQRRVDQYRTYCKFESVLARIIQEQGRDQLSRLSNVGAQKGQGQWKYIDPDSDSGYWTPGSYAGSWYAAAWTWPKHCQEASSTSAAADRMFAYNLTRGGLGCPEPGAKGTWVAFAPGNIGRNVPRTHPMVGSDGFDMVYVDLSREKMTTVNGKVSLKTICPANDCTADVWTYPVENSANSRIVTKMKYSLKATPPDWTGNLANGGGVYQFTLKNLTIIPHTYGENPPDPSQPVKIQLFGSSLALTTPIEVPQNISSENYLLTSTPFPVYIHGGCDAVTKDCDYTISYNVNLGPRPWSAYTQKTKNVCLIDTPFGCWYSVKATWDKETNPDCRGFTIEEMMSLDFSKMDLTEYIESITEAMEERTSKLKDNFKAAAGMPVQQRN